MFTQQDLQQIEKHGLTPEAVELQLEIIRCCSRKGRK